MENWPRERERDTKVHEYIEEEKEVKMTEKKRKIAPEEILL